MTLYFLCVLSSLLVGLFKVELASAILLYIQYCSIFVFLLNIIRIKNYSLSVPLFHIESV